DLALLRRQLTAPGLLVVAVASPRGTRRVRIALDPAGPTLEASNGQAPSHWSWTSVPELPAVIGELLGAAGIEPAPAHLTRSSEGLRLDPRQNRAVRAALAQGAGPEEAYTAAEDLDERLRDALTATGPRLSLSVVLHDPTGAITERPVSFSRLWVSGELGMYRMDDPHRDGDAILPVTHGDVLGTALPLLEEGLRFTAAWAASRGARRTPPGGWKPHSCGPTASGCAPPPPRSTRCAITSRPLWPAPAGGVATPSGSPTAGSRWPPRAWEGCARTSPPCPTGSPVKPRSRMPP